MKKVSEPGCVPAVGAELLRNTPIRNIWRLNAMPEIPVLDVMLVPPESKPVVELPSALMPVLILPQLGVPHKVDPVMLLKLIV